MIPLINQICQIYVLIDMFFLGFNEHCTFVANPTGPAANASGERVTLDRRAHRLKP